MVARNLLGDLALEETQAEVRDTLKDVQLPSGQGIVVGNARSKFRDGFASAGTQPDPAAWNLVNDSPDTGDGQGHIIVQGGNAAGSSYLRISMSPFVDNSSVWLTSKEKFTLPTKVGWGISASQRIVGQECFFGLMEASDDVSEPTRINRNPALAPADVAIQGTLGTVASNNVTVQMPANHPFKTGDRVILLGCPDTRLNVGPVIISAASPVDITVPVTLTNGTYTVQGGSVRYADPIGRANNGFGLLLENAAATNGSLVSRRNGSKARILNMTIATSLAVSPPNWSDSFLSPSVHEQFCSMDDCGVRSFAADAVAGMSGYGKYSQSIPDEELSYRLAFRARNLDDFSKPIARITNIQKVGTTATITTDRPHGLTTSSRVGLYGASDQPNFPNFGDGAVTSVPTSTTFTLPWGPSATITNTNGGVVFLNHGLVNSPGAVGYAITAISRTNNVMIVTLNGGASGFTPGEFFHLWGMNGTGAAAYEGAYRILRQTGSTIELDAPGANFGSITTGGAVIRRTEFRLHFARVMDHTRNLVEVIGGRGNLNDTNTSVPVAVVGSVSLNTNAPAVTGETLESTTVLAANGLYSGALRDMGTDTGRTPTRFKVMVRHNAGLIPGSLYLEQSLDNVNWYETNRVPVPSDSSIHSFEFPILTRYSRFRFQNGSIIQTGFLLNARRAWSEGTVADEVGKNLPFQLTLPAGQAAASNAQTTFPTLDLGVNHKWDQVRVAMMADQTSAASGVRIQQSMDGTTWGDVSGPGSTTIAVAGTWYEVECRVQMRYIRAIHVNGTTAATAVRANMSLISL